MVTEFFFDILLINFASLSDSIFISNIFFFIAKISSSSVFPTPEKTIFFGLIPAFKAIFNSPIDTTSAPQPSLFKFFKISKFEFDLTEKQIKGLILLKQFLKLFKFNFI